MGYHDLEPVAFLISEAVRNTNTAEEAALYDNWIRKCNEKLDKILNGKEKLATDQDNEFSAKMM